MPPEGKAELVLSIRVVVANVVSETSHSRGGQRTVVRGWGRRVKGDRSGHVDIMLLRSFKYYQHCVSQKIV